VLGKDLKMSGHHPEQRANIQLSARVEKYARETLYVLKDSCNDKDCQEQNWLVGTENLEESRKLNLMHGKR
jgi:hypothetical protein